MKTIAHRVFLVTATAVIFFSLVAVQTASAAVVSITPSKDNTLYENDSDASSGAGPTLFSGETGGGGTGSRRAVVAFDIGAQIPAGSTINSVTLRMNVSQAGFNAGADVYGLHRLTADWGEGSSNAGSGGGSGAPAASGDATWSHRFFGTAQTWTTLGGDFAASPSGSTVAATSGDVTWDSTSGLVADVQSWLDGSAGNFGWILIGNEAGSQNARRFGSRESTIPPTLTVNYAAGMSNSSGAVPNGDSLPGTPLQLDKQEGDMIELTWGASCVIGDTDYAVYEGLLAGSFDNHAFKSCSTGGFLSQSFMPIVADSYYLVLPTNGTREGSYGTDSTGDERPPGTTVCLPQSIGDPVCP